MGGEDLAVHLDGDDLANVVGLHLPLDVSLLNLLAQAGDLIRRAVWRDLSRASAPGSLLLSPFPLQRRTPKPSYCRLAGTEKA